MSFPALLLTLASVVPVTATPVLVNDPAALAQAEASGASLAVQLGAAPGLDNAKLHAASAAYRDLVSALSRDLAAVQKGDPLLATGMARSHRLFDARWLTSPAARYELVAVVNRLDRRSFAPETCGELRLVYRLGYESGRTASRLPLTVNVVYVQPQSKDGDCAPVARRWLGISGKSGAALGAWLVGPEGPASPQALRRSQLKSVEANLQSVRWPSTVRPDLGAHAEYMLRVFRPKGEGLAQALLENTPDVARLAKNPASKRALEAWVRANLPAIDAGTAVMPDEFLARDATSVSPRGLTRLANRPATRLFGERAFADVDFAAFRHVKSQAALLRRLDDSSCVGCHQARTVAGFHALGVDVAAASSANAVHVTGSPHLALDLPRRERFLAAVAAGRAADDARPLSERAEGGEGGYGSHCGLGDPGFAAWTCDAGLVCKDYGNAKGDRTVGQCFPGGAVARVGDPCETGVMRPHVDARRDEVRRGPALSCGEGVCEANRVGFPEGMCAVPCGTGGKDETCGAIAVLAGFNACLGRSRPFTECLEQHVRPAGLRRCDESMPCRDDYLCARTAKGEGACIPPYFLFQMRVDGHPRP